MPTTGSYQFKLAPKAIGGIIQNEMEILPGEWAWIDRTVDYQAADLKETAQAQAIPWKQQSDRWLMIYACCPDCKLPVTLYRRRGAGEGKGHDIDAQGNISPSVLHSYMFGDPPVERCGFHTQPTKLLDFIDLRGT